MSSNGFAVKTRAGQQVWEPLNGAHFREPDNTYRVVIAQSKCSLRSAAYLAFDPYNDTMTVREFFSALLFPMRRFVTVNQHGVTVDRKWAAVYGPYSAQRVAKRIIEKDSPAPLKKEAYAVSVQR